jgi:hypothetical protein
MATTLCARRSCLPSQTRLTTGSTLRRLQSSNAAPSPSPRQRTRSRDSQRNTSDVNLGKVDLVGPPDPLSNIRPMFYAPIASSSSSSSIRATQPLPHPYSLDEFSQTKRGGGRSGKGASSSRMGLGFFKGYRDYVDRVSQRVEEEEMKLRVSKMSTDTITQRFWKDNNLRFNRDLDNWREESHRRVAALPDGVMNEENAVAATGSTATSTSTRSLEAAEEMSKDESAFYANWLQANGKRNRSYNVLVWKQAWEQVRLGARVAYLRNWFTMLQSMYGTPRL